MPSHPIWMTVIFFGAMFAVCLSLTLDESGDLLSRGIVDGILSLIPNFAMGLWLLLVVLWNLFGRVHLRLTRDEAFLRREIFGFGLSRYFAPDFVKNLRVTERPVSRFGIVWNPYALPEVGGMLSFDYGEKTVRFASNLDGSEACFVADRINHVATWLQER